LDVSGLGSWTYQGYPLGELCLPGLRWALRRHDLPDDPAVRNLYRKYLGSAAGLVSQFEDIFEHESPRALIIFNGITYPEAVARAVAERRGIPTVTHEVGLQPQSAYFSHEEATFRQVPLPMNYELSEAEQAKLDRYLERRRKGQFSMAGVEFWPQMKALPEVIRKEQEQYEKMVVVFTNVIFDTSQVHANVIFDDMFSWLDSLSEVIEQHPETLFVLRAHPDENRPGKEAVQSVEAWFESSGLETVDNVLFYSPDEFVSSYHLIEAAHLVLVYNSSIGLEASIMGAPVLSAGRARFTAADTVFMPEDRQSYLEILNSFLLEKTLAAPEAHARNSRRFLFRELHEASLDFSEYLSPYPDIQGMVIFKTFQPSYLLSDSTIDVLISGVLEGRQFFERNNPSGLSRSTN
jgi:UDP-N-acetylglucosamine 2-epimerase